MRQGRIPARQGSRTAYGALAAICACATAQGPTTLAPLDRFSPSSKLKVLFFDLSADGVPEADLRRAGDIFAASLADARGAEILLARILPEYLDEATRGEFEADKSPRILGRRARELGADVAATGIAARVGPNLYAVAIEAVDREGVVIDGFGAKVSGDFGAAATAIRAAGHKLLAPLPVPDGPPTSGDAARAIAARSGLFDRCYALALRRKNTLVGRGVIEVSLAGGSSAVSAGLAASSFGDEGMEACLLDAVKSMRFPALPGTTTLRVPVAYVQ